jgi:hypothetical protein
MDKNIIGEFEGDLCNRNKCTGMIIPNRNDESCYCNATDHPPCGVCTAGIHCNECDYNSGSF